MNCNLEQEKVNRMQKNLTTKFLGRHYYFYKEIDSTQKEIWRRIQNNSITNGTIIRAEKQTSGIGTHGRKWITENNNIAISFYMELQCNIRKIEGLTTEIAEVIVNNLKEKYNIQLEIKLPNDIYYKGKKIGGILTEAKIQGDLVKFIVVGIGINNAQKNFEGELKNIASSIKNEFEITINTMDFIVDICNSFEKIIINRIEEDK